MLKLSAIKLSLNNDLNSLSAPNTISMNNKIKLFYLPTRFCCRCVILIIGTFLRIFRVTVNISLNCKKQHHQLHIFLRHSHPYWQYQCHSCIFCILLSLHCLFFKHLYSGKQYFVQSFYCYLISICNY